YVVFFLLFFPAHRVLHSFPTRRSSDLVESMLLRHHRPKIQQYETCSLIVATVFTVTQSTVRFGEVQLLFGEDFLVSIWRNTPLRSEEHTSELQSRFDLVCRLLLAKKKQ